jgi:hypothetical protein
LVSWTPGEAQGPSTNTVTVRVTDNGSPNLSGTNSFTVIVNEVNSAPSLTVPTTQTVDELTALNVAVSASDSDLPANTLTFALVTAPSGVSINASSGLVSWTPTETQDPSTNTVTVRVTDNGSPNLSATNSFTIIVNEVNAAPSLTVPANQTLNELATLNVAASATDSDLPTNTLTFSLDAAPSGMTINSSSGAIAWTPSESQGPSTNTVTVRVTDNGSPNLSDTKSFIVTVNEVNAAPSITVPANQTLDELTPLTVAASASDSDLPANTLTFALLTAPSGLTIDASSGAIAWTPSEAQGPSTNTVTVRVTDNGSPNLSATNSFTVVVNEVNSAPTIVSNADLYLNELTTLTLTNVASDSDLPANTLTFTLATAPTGMTINATNGVLTWTPTEAQGPSINPVDVVVTDNGAPTFSATNHFTVLVGEVNTAPTLAPLADVTLAVNSNLSVTATATDSDLPANRLTFSLVSAPAGMRINASSGLITWTPSTAQRPSSNYVTVQVSDNARAPLTDTQSFSVRAVIGDDVTAPTVAFTTPVAEFRTNATTLTVTGTASDNRALARVRICVNGGAYADASGTTNWSATVALDPGTNTVTVFSEDDSGNISSGVTRKFFRIVTARLTVNYFGSGTASPNLNGTMLELNRTYTITAQPQPDWMLTNWTGGVTSRVVALTFTMTTNLIINANFVANPIVAVAGNYNALFAETSGATVASAGFVSVTLSKSGAFSAAMQADGRSYALAGVVGLNGHGSAQVSRPAKTPLTLDLQFDLNGGSDSVTGSVSSLEWNAPLLGDRVIVSTNFAGKYTLLLPGCTNVGEPAGFGYATASATNSTFTVAGALADGTALKQTVAVSKRGDWPVFIPLYSGPLLYTNASPPITLTVYRGALIGWAHVTNTCSPTVCGSLVWVKNPCTNGNIFTNGFEVNSEATGARYVAPAAGGRAVNLTNGVVSLTGCDVAAAANFSISTANAVTFAAPNANKCALTIAPATGLVKLTFTPTGSTKARTASGVILQASNFIGGSFVGTNTTGTFTAQ